MTRARRAAGRTFEAFRTRNYRRYFAGQVISVSGVWMQMVAQTWLVLQLTGSGAALGTVTAAQFLPMLILGPWAGVIADRVDKRRFLLVLQIIPAMLAVALGLLTLVGATSFLMVIVFALSLGMVTAFEVPTRQAFAFELVGADLLPNAVSLNSVVMNGARVAGPVIGAILLGAGGAALCFFINALTYVAAMIALLTVRTDELHRCEPSPRAKGQLRDGLRYVWSEPHLRTPLLLMLVIGALTYEFPVTLPLLSSFTFERGPEGYSLLLATMSVGAVVGGLVAAALHRPSHRHLGLAGAALGLFTALAGLAPNITVAALVMPLVGMASIAFVSRSNATLQLNSRPEMRGRVIALFAVAFLGTSPIGGPIIGWVAQSFGPRSALVLGGTIAMVAVAIAWRSLASHDRTAAARHGDLVPLPRREPLTGLRPSPTSHAGQLAS